MVALSVNQVSLPGLAWTDLVALARKLGCSGVELRNDLERPLFDGDQASAVQSKMKSEQMTLFGVAQIYPFNDLDAAGRSAAQVLVSVARDAGAEGVALIPRVGGSTISFARTVSALEDLLPIFKDAGLRGFVEPVGFAASSLRTKAEALRAIVAARAEEFFSLIHDTFHHHIASEKDIFPAQTAMVHVSGVARPLSAAAMTDADRGLVGTDDQLGTLQQLRELKRAGFNGPISVEAFSPDVQQLEAPAEHFSRCLQRIREALD